MAFFQSLTETEQYVNQALAQLQIGNDGDEVYHPLYLAWRSFQRNPDQLNSISNYGNFGMGFSIFLSYNTVSDIDDRQQLASIAYLFISKAIEQNPSNPNLYKNRLLILMQHNEAFQYTVSSVVNKDSDWFNMSLNPFKARDAMYKMEYYDLCVSPLLMQIDMFASQKKNLENKIRSEFFGRNETEISIKQQGLALHQEVLAYLEKKVLEEQDLDF